MSEMDRPLVVYKIKAEPQLEIISTSRNAFDPLHETRSSGGSNEAGVIAEHVEGRTHCNMWPATDGGSQDPL